MQTEGWNSVRVFPLAEMQLPRVNHLKSGQSLCMQTGIETESEVLLCRDGDKLEYLLLATRAVRAESGQSWSIESRPRLQQCPWHGSGVGLLCPSAIFWIAKHPIFPHSLPQALAVLRQNFYLVKHTRHLNLQRPASVLALQQLAAEEKISETIQVH